MQSVVITGASGFVGAYLRGRLVSMGMNVIPVSRSAYTDMIQVEDYTQSPIGDILIHLAEEPDREVVNQSGESYLVNASRVAAALVARKYKRVIYVSSGAVYGNASPTPRKTSDEVFPTDIYNQAKLINEKVVLASGGGVARLSNIFGEGMSGNNVMSDIIRQVPGQGPLVVRDDLSVRDFLHVSDAADALAAFSLSRHIGILNIGTGIGTTVRRLVDIALLAVAQSGREVVVTSPRRSGSTNILDISETSKVLGWRPRANLADKLSELVTVKAGSIHEQ